MTPLRTLIIEDNADDVRLVVDALQSGGFDVTPLRVESAAELIMAQTRGPWDVVLCDMTLPQFDGDQALRLTAASMPDVPVIVVTGTIGEERLADTMRSGARDFVLKTRLERLAPAVRREIAAARARVQRRALEEQLRREQERFRALIEKSPEPVTVTDRNGTVLYASPSAQNLFGYEHNEYSGHTIFEFLHPGDVAPARRNLAQLAVAPNGGFKEEVRCLRKDGARRWVEISVSNLLDDPDVGGLVVAYHDVTERRNAEEERNRERQRAEALLELLQNPSRSPDEILQFTVEQAVSITESGLGFVAFVNDDRTLSSVRVAAQGSEAAALAAGQFAHHRDWWSEDLDKGRAVVVNERASPASGETKSGNGDSAVRRFLIVPVLRGTKPVLMCGLANKPEPYHDADVLHVRLFVQGVWGAIENARHEQALRRNETYFRALTEQSLDVIVVVSEERKVTYQSLSVERVLGWPPAEVLGRNILDFVHPADTALAERWLTRLPLGAIDQGILRVRHRDGSYRTMEVIARNLQGDANVGGFVANARDITERKALEAQYLHSQKLEAFGQLAGGVAHDFNNILAVMLMHFSLMQLEPGIPPAVIGWLTELENLANRAAALTRQLLIFGRRQEMAMQVVDLNRVVENVCGMLQRLIGENIAFAFNRAAKPLWIEGDSGMIEQVATNLCVNARDAMPDGGRLHVTLTATRRCRTETGADSAMARTGGRPATPPPADSSATAIDVACLEITDTGCGMDETTKKRIFEPFFTTKPVGHGTGLGLATVYGIARQHRAWIEVDTAPGQGSAFRVYFPLVPAPSGEPKEAPAVAPTLGGSETVLLVEDEDLVRKTLAFCLRRAGYTVVEASNGATALEQWQQGHGKFDLLVTDMIMPGGVTGLQLAKKLVAADSELRVVIVSGYTAQPIGSNSPFAPHVVHLAKPCSPDLLLKTVRRVLDAS